MQMLKCIFAQNEDCKKKWDQNPQCIGGIIAAISNSFSAHMACEYCINID